MPQTDDPEIDDETSREDDDPEQDSLLDMYGSHGDPDMDTFAPPVFWPAIPATDVVARWTALRAWVEALVLRYPHLDHHVIPRCWWQHAGHVEALQALRDHERASFASSAVATAATDWQWRFALIEGRLREWTAQAGCGSAHRVMTVGILNPDQAEWARMIEADRIDRSNREISGDVPEPGRRSLTFDTSDSLRQSRPGRTEFAPASHAVAPRPEDFPSPPLNGIETDARGEPQ